MDIDLGIIVFAAGFWAGIIIAIFVGRLCISTHTKRMARVQ
jgi:hypothetical protein